MSVSLFSPRMAVLALALPLFAGAAMAGGMVAPTDDPEVVGATENSPDEGPVTNVPDACIDCDVVNVASTDDGIPDGVVIQTFGAHTPSEVERTPAILPAVEVAKVEHEHNPTCASGQVLKLGNCVASQ